MSATQLAARLDDLIDHIANGKIIEAMEEFYAEDSFMEEPAYGRTSGLAANIEREKNFVAGVAEWKRFDVTARGASDASTFYECVMEWTTTDGQEIHVEQVAVADWRDGKIVRERFYYDTGGA